MSLESPRFQDPPIIERVISLQFERLEVSTTQMAEAWFATFRDKFPITSDQPVLPSLIETFGLPDALPIGSLIPPVNQVRQWFQSQDGTDLLQAQQTRFIRNWRKEGGALDYMPFEDLVADFQDNAKDWFAALGVTPKINQIEVTYVNHIDDKGEEAIHLLPSRYFTFFDLPEIPPISAKCSLTREHAATILRYEITSPDFEPEGRLFVKADPAFRKNMTPIWVLDLTARARPSSDSLDDAIAMCQRAHDLLVTAFTTLTTEEMHSAWGKTKP